LIRNRNFGEHLIAANVGDVIVKNRNVNDAREDRVMQRNSAVPQAMR
jgi:hypothetical protein